ncbi:hypothetical protein OG302_31085 [Streptomyces sp. NBC_01283]|nr:hypothetical protein OG302_31085 [Streptomyces sp. NBC_01283]
MRRPWRGGPAGRVIEGVVGHTAQLEAPGEVVSAVEATMAG